ncbi:MAG: NHL repeat-containing protein [Chitinophagales bacterium]
MMINRLLFAISSICIVSCNLNRDQVTVSTLAGNGRMGFESGRLRESSFSNPMAVASDGKGNLYIADSRNNLIRKIDREGQVSTIAGSGAAGSDDGPGRTASFFYPQGIAVDKSGNIFIADTHNNLIRKMGLDGMVKTIAGKRIGKSTNQIDSSVRFDNPSGIAVDDDGDLYVSDWANNLIRKISPEGRVINIAGNGAPGSKDGKDSSASFYLPWGIAVDAHKNLYVADCYNNRIRKIDRDGMVTTIAGHNTKGASNGKGVSASFQHPTGIAVDKKENIYVADTENNCIRKISPDGVVSTYAGNGYRGAADGPAPDANFYRPYGIVVNDQGDIFVADYENNLIREIRVKK